MRARSGDWKVAVYGEGVVLEKLEEEEFEGDEVDENEKHVRVATHEQKSVHIFRAFRRIAADG